MKGLTRNVVVLAANSDIGKALIAYAASSGCTVIAVSRSPAPAVENRLPDVRYIDGVDLCDEQALLQLAGALRATFHQAFSVICCAGDFWVHKPLVRTDFSEIRRMVESHLISLCGAARFLTPVMMEVGGGRLVAFSCNSVGYNYPDLAPFTASKAAVETFIKCYAHEYAEKGISGFTIALPTILTEKVLREKKISEAEVYISPEELSAFVVRSVLAMPHEASGTVLKVFRHSPSFYRTGYFDRNPREFPLAP